MDNYFVKLRTNMIQYDLPPPKPTPAQYEAIEYDLVNKNVQRNHIIKRKNFAQMYKNKESKLWNTNPQKMNAIYTRNKVYIM